MADKMLGKLMRVWKKTHAEKVDVYLPSAWGQGIMLDVYAAASVPQSPFERFAPRVAMTAGVMLLAVAVPCIVTVNNVLSLLDTQLVEAGRDSAQLFLSF